MMSWLVLIVTSALPNRIHWSLFFFFFSRKEPCPHKVVVITRYVVVSRILDGPDRYDHETLQHILWNHYRKEDGLLDLAIPKNSNIDNLKLLKPFNDVKCKHAVDLFDVVDNIHATRNFEKRN